MASNFSHSSKYDDSDLQVTLPGGRVYHLHAGVFRRASGFFAQFLAEDLGAVLSPKAKRDGVNLRYRIDLVGTDTGNARFVSRVCASMLAFSRKPYKVNYINTVTDICLRCLEY